MVDMVLIMSDGRCILCLHKMRVWDQIVCRRKFFQYNWVFLYNSLLKKESFKVDLWGYWILPWLTWFSCLTKPRYFYINTRVVLWKLYLLVLHCAWKSPTAGIFVWHMTVASKVCIKSTNYPTFNKENNSIFSLHLSSFFLVVFSSSVFVHIDVSSLFPLCSYQFFFLSDLDSIGAELACQ